MKKILFISTLIATLLLASSCNKDQELVTLGAVISQPGKTYIDDRYPCWNNGDQVYVNNTAYPISAASGSSAQIANVVSADGYRAIFPASLVPANMDITNSSSIPVTLPATQVYTLVDGHQRVNAPMGAYTDGEVLQFHNLCSIVHVVVNNNTGSDMALDKLRIATDNAYLSGTGTATVTGADNDGITLSSDASHSVSLRIAGPTSVTLAAGAQSSFDIYVPAFPTDNVTITLYTTNGYYFELTKNSVALTPNTYTTVTLNVTSLTQILAAELVDGPTFNAAIPRNATAVVFEYSSSVSSGTLLSASSSPVPIYGNLDGTTWRVSTSASMMNANPDCGSMFSVKNNIISINFGEGFNTSNVTDMSVAFNCCSSLTSLDLSNFNTENVTDMNNLFAGCSGLISLDLSNFNTENVTDMSQMFQSCSSLISLDLSNFNTENVTSMGYMFLDCSGLTSLDLSNFNTENVTDMRAMFCGCSGLTSLDVSHFNTQNVTETSAMDGGMFYGCSSLISLDLSNFNTENMTDMWTMFYGCSSLTSLDISNFNTENVEFMSEMFSGCESLTSLDLSNFNTENVITMWGMFSDCKSLTNLVLSHFDMSNVTEPINMCYNLSTTSRHCTITCPAAVEDAIKETDPYYNPTNSIWEHGNYYYSGLPTSGVTFNWVRPSSK
jgi:surface protein